MLPCTNSFNAVRELHLIGLYPSPERFGLRVLAAKPVCISAMKLKALERTTADDRDYRDAVKLGIACGATTSDGLRDVFRIYLDHQNKAAQQVLLDPIPEPVGDPLADAWIGAAGEHLALRWGLRTPDWMQRAVHFALEQPHLRILAWITPPPIVWAGFPHQAPSIFTRLLEV
jgi:hypothetical protein